MILIGKQSPLLLPKRAKLVTRRRILAGAAAALAMPAIIGNAATFSQPFTLTGSAAGSFPGQPGNPVGYNHAPGYTSLTPWGGGGLTNGASPGSPTVYSHIDFGNTFSGGNVSWRNITFNGCRFTSNEPGNRNLQMGSTTCSDLIFNYCTFAPLTSLYTAPPGSNDGTGQDGLTWPSAGARDPSNPIGDPGMITNTNCIDGSSGSQYGLIIDAPTGLVTVDHCDFWGFGNFGPAIYGVAGAGGPSQLVTISDCWIHDPPNASPQGYHIDGTGYVNGGGGPNYYSVIHCTLAGIGNTNQIAFQTASSPYDHIVVNNCYLSGSGYVLDMCHNISGNNNLTCTNNTFATDLGWRFGPCYTDFTAQFAHGNANNNVWSGNKLKQLAGGNNFVSGGNDGDYLWPDGSFHATDF
jgi:hypothetical protein